MNPKGVAKSAAIGRVLCFAALAFPLASCAATSGPATGAIDQGPVQSSRWTWGCDLKAKDDFGESRRRSCFLMVNNFDADLTIGDAYTIKLQTLIEVDAKGTHVIRPERQTGCDRSPRRIAVDGKRIDSLPNHQMIAAILGGSHLTMEKQASWPACGIAPHATHLAGIRPAYEAMLAHWSAANASGAAP